MKPALKFLLILFCSLGGVGRGRLCAQQHENTRIDSLIQVLAKAGDDTNKVLLLDGLSFSFYTINPDKGLKYGQDELDLAQKLGWKKGTALANNSIGDNYLTKSEYPTALEYYFKAVKLNEDLGDKINLAKNLNHIGVVYKQQKDYLKALDYYLKALKINEEQENKSGIALNLGNIGNIYCFQGDYSRALEWQFKSLKIYEESGDNGGTAHVFGNIGLAYKNQENYSKALQYYFKGLKIDETLDQKNEIEIKLGNIGDCYLHIAKEAGAIKTDSLIPAGKIANLRKAIDFLKKAIAVSGQLGNLADLQTFFKNISEAQALSGNDKDALESYIQYTLYKDSVYSMENNEKIVKMDYDRRHLADSITSAEAKKLADMRLQHQRSYTYAGIAAIILLLGFSFFLVKERWKSEKLLLNILPAEVAAELKSKGITKARNFDNVTVLFTNFVNFNIAGEWMSPQQMVNELDNCFKAFDEIITRYKIEKIKTVGDTYLAVSGLPVTDTKHAENIVKAAIEINAFMQNRLAILGERTFEIRIGIHSGSVIAGIVGVKKFAYDIWGDTVNTAARMEQNSQAGKINISQTTYELVKDKFKCEYRGEIEAKNKGQMKMYFVS